MRELAPGARRVLCAADLPGALQPDEDRVIPRSAVKAPQLRGLGELCRAVPDWRRRKGRDYPLPSLLAIIVLLTVAKVMAYASFSNEYHSIRKIRKIHHPHEPSHCPKEGHKEGT